MRGEKPTEDAALVGEVAGPMMTGNGLVFIHDGHVAFEMANFGRLEFPPDVAETVARALLEGARRIREEQPPDGTIILRGS
jgi:hypothetical protein